MSHNGPAKKLFEIMSIDIIGGFEASRYTRKYLHLLIKHFTRYAYILNQRSNDFIKLVEYVSKNSNNFIPGINFNEFKTFLDNRNIPIA